MIHAHGMVFEVRCFKSRDDAESAMARLAAKVLSRRTTGEPKLAWPVSAACAIDADSARAFVTVYADEGQEWPVDRAIAELGGQPPAEQFPDGYFAGLAARRRRGTAMGAELGVAAVGNFTAPAILRADGSLVPFSEG